MHVVRLTPIMCYEIMAGGNLLATDPRSLTGTRVCPKGRKHIGGGEAPVYEKYQIHSPNGAVEIEESLWPVRLRSLEHILSSVRRRGNP